MTIPSAPHSQTSRGQRPPATQPRRPRDWASGMAALGHAMHTPPLWRIIRLELACLMFGVVALTTMFALAWSVTPPTAGLYAWVQGQDASHHAQYTPLARIAPRVLQALVAIEDERFYQHHGIDTIGLVRAAWADVRAGHIVQGGSTLTAQLAKNAFLNGYDHTIPLKLEDLLLAVKIEHRYSKGQIIEMYLNLVYYGQGAYGIGAAAQRYFGTTPARLDLAQAALLAGMVQAPGIYDPWCHPSLARARQQQVLYRMRADGYITQRQDSAAAAETFPFFAPGTKPPYDAYCAP